MQVEKLSTMKIEAEKSLDEQITKANEVQDVSSWAAQSLVYIIRGVAIA